jgi:hypothetical protein
MIAASAICRIPTNRYGYETPGSIVKTINGIPLLEIHAPNVHDFVWAAESAIHHISKKLRDGLTIHAFL